MGLLPLFTFLTKKKTFSPNYLKLRANFRNCNLINCLMTKFNRILTKLYLLCSKDNLLMCKLIKIKVNLILTN